MNATLAGTLISLMKQAQNKAELELVLDQVWNLKIAKRGTAAHGYFLFEDGSGLEMVESPDESDDIVFCSEVEWKDRSAN
jgi:hypothetical protein